MIDRNCSRAGHGMTAAGCAAITSWMARSGFSVEAARGDDGGRGGIEPGTPIGSEGPGDLAEDDGGPQGSLAAVIGVGHIASGDEDEKIVPAFPDGAGELSAGRRGRRLAQQPGEAAIEIGPILNERPVLEGLAPPADGDGSQEAMLEARGAGGVALVDCILAVAQQMGEAALALHAMPVLTGLTD